MISCPGRVLATNYVQGATLPKLSIHRGCMLIKWNSPLWPTLVHVHIATEVLDTPGANRAVFHYKDLVDDIDR